MRDKIQNNIESIKIILQRNGIDNVCDDDYGEKAESKLEKICEEALADGDGFSVRKRIKAIKKYISAGETEKRKLYAFCLDFFDPTDMRILPNNDIPILSNNSGERIQRHKFLQNDEIKELYEFVKRHTKDVTFGETVYKVMEKHSMTAPDVYRNALLRRQDFSRAVDSRTKSVTRQLAWQIIIGLHCSLQEADEVLFSAGFIRRNNAFDLTMEYFIKQRNYDVFAINDVLSEFNVKPFSCYMPVRDKDNE